MAVANPLPAPVVTRPTIAAPSTPRNSTPDPVLLAGFAADVLAWRAERDAERLAMACGIGGAREVVLTSNSVARTP